MSNQFNINEYFSIKAKISLYDAFYEALFNLTSVSFDNSVDTAAVSFDKEGNFLSMKINQPFWNSLNEHAKTFVIIHELYHIVYDHAKRAITSDLDLKTTNIAADIVINHKIHNNLHINRNLFDWKKFCWVETCFPIESVPSNLNFEFYYNKLIENKFNQDLQLLGNHSNNPSNDNRNDNSNNQQSDDFSDVIKDIISQNPELVDSIKNSDELRNDFPKELIKAPLGKGNEGTLGEVDMSGEKPNFDNLMKILIPKKHKKELQQDTWVGFNRRFTHFLNVNKDLFIPNQLPKEITKKNKKQIWVFMDSSGSCHSMYHTFGKIVKELMNNKDLICRGFAFGDDVSEVNLNSHQIKFYSGNDGGFDCIENEILKIMKKEKCQYPDNVVVLSDGGVHFSLRDKLLKPKNWILLINNKSSTELLPKGAKYFHVDNAFFKLSNKHKI